MLEGVAMISVVVEMNANGLTDPALTIVCDTLGDLERLADDMLDWSVGADIGAGTMEIEFTVAVEDSEAAIKRAHEWIWSAIRASGGTFDDTAERKVSAELLSA